MRLTHVMPISRMEPVRIRISMTTPPATADSRLSVLSSISLEAIHRFSRRCAGNSVSGWTKLNTLPILSEGEAKDASSLGESNNPGETLEPRQ